MDKKKAATKIPPAAALNFKTQAGRNPLPEAFFYPFTEKLEL